MKIYPKNTFKFLTIFLIVLNTISCKSKEVKITPEYLYLKAYKLLEDKDYLMSAEEFEKIDDEFPFTKWAIKGQVMALYANYRLKEYEKVIQLADDFIKLHPNNEHIPYMLYMKGLSYYYKIPSIERAQDFTKESSLAFRELIARFSNNDYASDALEKITFIDEHLAGAQMSIARYQINSGNYIGALEHLYEVINRYRNTSQASEAYFRITEIYYRIGLKDEAKENALILINKFPDNYWSKEANKFIK